MKKRNEACVLTLAVKIQRERIGDMDADRAEHALRMRGTLLLHLG
jgi:hypothetical protein